MDSGAGAYSQRPGRSGAGADEGTVAGAGWAGRAGRAEQERLPVDGYFLGAAEAVEVFDMAVGASEFMNGLGDLDIVGAVFRDFHDSAFAPPLDGFETVGGFADA